MRPAIDFFASKGCDAVILGCTHFLNIKDVFEKVALRQAQGPQDCIKIVDSVDGVVRHAISISEVQPKTRGQASLYITGEENPSYKIACSTKNITFGGKI